MTKDIFTKTQAISILTQAKDGKKVNIFAAVDPKHSLFRLTCDELETKLHQYIDKDDIAGVVEDPVFNPPL